MTNWLFPRRFYSNISSMYCSIFSMITADIRADNAETHHTLRRGQPTTGEIKIISNLRCTDVALFFFFAENVQQTSLECWRKTMSKCSRDLVLIVWGIKRTLNKWLRYIATWILDPTVRLWWIPNIEGKFIRIWTCYIFTCLWDVTKFNNFKLDWFVYVYCFFEQIGWTVNINQFTQHN